MHVSLCPSIAILPQKGQRLNPHRHTMCCPATCASSTWAACSGAFLQRATFGSLVSSASAASSAVPFCAQATKMYREWMAPYRTTAYLPDTLFLQGASCCLLATSTSPVTSYAIARGGGPRSATLRFSSAYARTTFGFRGQNPYSQTNGSRRRQTICIPSRNGTQPPEAHHARSRHTTRRP